MKKLVWSSNKDKRNKRCCIKIVIFSFSGLWEFLILVMISVYILFLRCRYLNQQHSHQTAHQKLSPSLSKCSTMIQWDHSFVGWLSHKMEKFWLFQLDALNVVTNWLILRICFHDNCLPSKYGQFIGILYMLYTKQFIW